MAPSSPLSAAAFDASARHLIDAGNRVIFADFTVRRREPNPEREAFCTGLGATALACITWETLFNKTNVVAMGLDTVAGGAAGVALSLTARFALATEGTLGARLVQTFREGLTKKTGLLLTLAPLVYGAAGNAALNYNHRIDDDRNQGRLVVLPHLPAAETAAEREHSCPGHEGRRVEIVRGKTHYRLECPE